MNFSELLLNSLKKSELFKGFEVLTYGIKDIRAYLIDSGSHILPLIQNNIEQS